MKKKRNKLNYREKCKLDEEIKINNFLSLTHYYSIDKTQIYKINQE